MRLTKHILSSMAIKLNTLIGFGWEDEENHNWDKVKHLTYQEVPYAYESLANIMN